MAVSRSAITSNCLNYRARIETSLSLFAAPRCEPLSANFGRTKRSRRTRSLLVGLRCGNTRGVSAAYTRGVRLQDFQPLNWLPFSRMAEDRFVARFAVRRDANKATVGVEVFSHERRSDEYV